MPALEAVLAAVMTVSLVLYALMGGADYGGGVWDLLARGPRQKEQRRLIAEALGPIWEANHVWLILGIVVLFTAFPPAFAAIATQLHVPLTLLLLGIVLRGSSFAFRAHDRHDRHGTSPGSPRRWGLVFAAASTATPVLLGVTAGAIASGDLRAGGSFTIEDFFLPWLAPFPWAVGCLALVLFSFLAAVYLTLEAEHPALREDFRGRALASGAAAPVLAATVFFLSRRGAPAIWRGLSASGWAAPLQAAAGAMAAGALAALWRRKYRAARACAAGEVALVICGWAAAQLPCLVPAEITLYNAAAPAATLRLLVASLAAGALLLFPSFLYLYRVFGRR